MKEFSSEDEDSEAWAAKRNAKRKLGNEEEGNCEVRRGLPSIEIALILGRERVIALAFVAAGAINCLAAPAGLGDGQGELLPCTHASAAARTPYSTLTFGGPVVCPREPEAQRAGGEPSYEGSVSISAEPLLGPPLCTGNGVAVVDTGATANLACSKRLRRRNSFRK